MIVDNPAYAGETPRILEPACHDRTPMIDVRCAFCGGENHVHESQIAGAPSDADLAMRCARCGLPSVTTVALFREAFAELHHQGWIA